MSDVINDVFVRWTLILVVHKLIRKIYFPYQCSGLMFIVTTVEHSQLFRYTYYDLLSGSLCQASRQKYFP
jgi:hypothetical protein